VARPQTKDDGNQLPGKEIIISDSFSPGKLIIRTDSIQLQSGAKYRITSFYESRVTNNFRPDLQLKIQQSNSIYVNKHLSTNSGSGSRDGNIYWGHNNYGLFSVPSSDIFKLSIYADNYPKDFIVLKIFISENASNFGRNSFIAAGLVMFLILFIRKGKTKVSLK
jgi:hypothetical protein